MYYRDLEVWQLAMKLAEDVYTATSEMPAEERFTLGRQIRDCATSISANIAEGSGWGRNVRPGLFPLGCNQESVRVGDKANPGKSV